MARFGGMVRFKGGLRDRCRCNYRCDYGNYLQMQLHGDISNITMNFHVAVQ